MTEKQNELHHSLNRYLNSKDDDPELALKITRGYQKMFGRGFKASQQTVRLTVKTIPLDLKKYRGTPFYKTMKRLNSFVQKRLTPFISYFFIHGSLATMDYAHGFSDLDTYVFVKKNVCVSPKKLKRLKNRLTLAKNLLREVDPNGHHGFLCCNEDNLGYYCNAFMPIPVFRNAKILLGSNRITFHLRDSRIEHRLAFERFAGILLNPKRFGPDSVNPFDFKYFIAVLLLMPTLYLQARGSNLYKKHSFRLYTHSLLNKATLVRKYFGQKPLKELRRILGRDYLKQVKNMISEMKLDLKKQEKQNNSYTNKPIPIPMNIYEKAREELINNLKNNPDVAAVYEYGRVQSPGISDLDLIVVTHGDLKSSRPEDFRITPNKFPNASRVATGTLMLMSRKNFADIKFFDEVNLSKLWGEDIPLNNIEKRDLKQREIASVVDWLPERLARLARMLKQPKLDVQNSLLYLRSFCYDLEKVSKLTGDPYFAQMTPEVLETRSLWLKNKETDLRQLITRLIYTGYEALAVFTDRFFKEKCDTEGELLLFPWQKIIFTKDSTQVDPDIAISFSTADMATAPVSSRLLSHFLVYSRQSGILPREMRKQFRTNTTPKINIGQSYENFLKKKMSLANSYADFLLKNGFESGLYRFGFYFISKK